MTIDMHAHWAPKNFCDLLRRRTIAPRIFRGEGGAEYFESRVFCDRLAHDHESGAARIALMDRHGIGHAVLSMSAVAGVEALPIHEAHPLIRAYNDAVSAECVRHPGRFSAYAMLPIGDMAAAVVEFRRTLQLPGIVGAVLPGDGFLTKQRAERFRPLFELANEQHAILLVHYGRLPDDAMAPKPETTDNSADRLGTLDMQSRISSNMVTFCMTDFLLPYPDVTVQCHNLGGNIPFEIDRMDHNTLYERPGDILPSFRVRAAPILVDSNSHSSRTIELAVQVYGAEKVVFGSDGTEFGMAWMQRAISEARLSEGERQAIRVDNARRVLARVQNRISA